MHQGNGVAATTFSMVSASDDKPTDDELYVLRYRNIIDN